MITSFLLVPVTLEGEEGADCVKPELHPSGEQIFPETL